MLSFKNYDAVLQTKYRAYTNVVLKFIVAMRNKTNLKMTNQFWPQYIDFERHTSMLCSIHRISGIMRDRVLLKLKDAR